MLERIGVGQLQGPLYLCAASSACGARWPAVKVLRGSKARDEDAVRRFEREGAGGLPSWTTPTSSGPWDLAA